MIYTIFDDSVSYLMNVFLVIGNIISLVYNIPQMIKTYKTKSTKDFSSTFLFMRVINNSIWFAYSIELGTFLFLISNITSVIGSVFISYYKVIELYNIYKKTENTTTIIELKDTFPTNIEIENNELDNSDTKNDINLPLID